MNFLPHFIHEEIYLIKEEKISVASDQPNDVEIQQPDNAQQNTELKYEGKNLKKILVLISNAETNFLHESEKIFLGKILHAVQLNFEDIAIVNTAKINDLHKINHFDCRYMISFGVVNDHLTINNITPFYKIINQEGVTFLLSDPLKTIEKDQDKKRKLWNSLKQLFSV